jgi:predicted site-specific integrase-resolvase
VHSADSEKLEPARLIGSRLGVEPRTVNLWARRGWIPAVRITAKVVRFEWQAVLAALRERGAAGRHGGAR